MSPAIATNTISGVVTSVSLTKWPIESPGWRFDFGIGMRV
jgi:hypothetical protein